jgi:AmiR/NasT family two-component response regulator
MGEARKSSVKQLRAELCRQQEENRQLRAALEAPPCVSHAVGVLMFRYGLDADRASDLLSRWSERMQLECGDFAQAVLDVVAKEPESLEVALFGPTPTVVLVPDERD